MCASLYIHNKYTHCTHIYHINKKVINRYPALNIILYYLKKMFFKFPIYKFWAWFSLSYCWWISHSSWKHHIMEVKYTVIKIWNWIDFTVGGASEYDTTGKETKWSTKCRNQETGKNTSLPSLFDPLTLALSILIIFDLFVFFIYIYIYIYIYIKHSHTWSSIICIFILKLHLANQDLS